MGDLEKVPDYFLKPGPLERAMNKAVALLVRIGIGPSYLWLLRVKHRRWWRR